MKLILRKNDSATSLLLFIYNNYMAKTNEDSIKLSNLLEILKVFGKSETAIRMSLSRAVKAGVLTNFKRDNEIIYTLTPAGKKAISLWNEGAIHFWERYKLRNSQWDNKWHLINVDIKEDNKAEFIEKLEEYGFTPTNSCTWISAYNLNEEVGKLINEYGLKNKVFEIYGELNTYGEMFNFLDKLYGIKKLEKSYEEFINTFGARVSEIKSVYEDKRFIVSGEALLILHELGWNFFSIAAGDPVLPKEVLPEWAGDKAANIMGELREMLIHAANKYFESLG